MRTLVVAMLLAACGSAPPRPEPLQGRADPAAATPSIATLDWPTLIGKPVAEAQQTITQFLGVPPKTDLNTVGVEIHQSKARVDTLFLHVMPESENGPTYKGPLFRGLQANMKRAQIVGVMGEPHETGGPDNDWIKYRLPEAQIHFEFRGTVLYMVTLMNPEWEPGA